MGATESTLIVREATAETLPATSTVRKFTVCVPLGKEAAVVCHAPPFTCNCRLAIPDTASVPVVETATGDVICHPFEPVAIGSTGVTVGKEASLAQVVEPVAEERPLVAAVAVKVIAPLPCDNATLQLLPASQVNGAPAIVPEIVKASPWGSEAVIFRVAVPIHQPLLPGTEQTTAPLIDGGLYVGSSSSHTTLQEKQHPLQPRPSWSLPAELQEMFLSQQLDQPLHGFLSLSVQVVVQFCPAALANFV